MNKNDFYRLYANTPLPKRAIVFAVDPYFILWGMTLNTVYQEIHTIDERLRHDEIRRQQLLDAIEPFLAPLINLEKKV